MSASIAEAVLAANLVFDDPTARIHHEPRGPLEIEAAVSTLAERFKAGGGTLNEIITNARSASEVLSSDPFQALSEIVQNADDTRATRVQIELRGGDLVISHDGRPLTLRDTHALAAPWLTTKKSEVDSVGRFGIGLSTLSALADCFEIHSGDYHVRFGDPLLEFVDDHTPGAAHRPELTTLYVPLRDPRAAQGALLKWAQRWDDSALLFLRSVAAISFTEQGTTRKLELRWTAISEDRHTIGESEASIRHREASAPDGRTWAVHDTDIPTPSGTKRAHKATGLTTPVAIAIDRSSRSEGGLYAGLPVSGLDAPVRICAHFDPIASRQDIAANTWNRSLIKPIAQVWAHAVAVAFRDDSASGWLAIPTGDRDDQNPSFGTELERALVETARTTVADELALEVAGQSYWIGDLAYEAESLDGRLTPDEIARLADLHASLPQAARDADGRWREVLDDWRSFGCDLAPPVTIADALRLFEDPDLAAERSISIAALALDQGVGPDLAGCRCVVEAGGSRIVPPRRGSTQFLAAGTSGLAAKLDLGTRLGDIHLADAPDSRRVVEWLIELGAMVADDDTAVLTRLASSASSKPPPIHMDDFKLVALREALERVGPAQWDALAPSIGMVVSIDGFRYDQRGNQQAVEVVPENCYLGRSLDKEPDSFAVAAAETPGITWAAPRYAKLLKSANARQGLGAQRFLRLLGAASTPRVVPHQGLEVRYSGRTPGLNRWTQGSPQERQRAISAVGGDYTLDDTESPDLDRVLANIGAEKKATLRRKRAGAILATLGRAWQALEESTEVTIAHAHHRWNRKGSTRSWWLWRAATIPWLDDQAATPRRPIDLRLQTVATEALHGDDPSTYLHRSFTRARSDVLEDLGVSGEPNTRELCQKVSELRSTTRSERSDAEVKILYRAIDNRLGGGSHTAGDLAPGQLRKAFEDGDLVLTNLGWRKPSQALAGPPIFGDHAPFAPSINGVDRLWKTLRIPLPGAKDCLDMLSKVAEQGTEPSGDDQSTMLDAFREVVRLIAEEPLTDWQRKRMGNLPLWTTQGWASDRPVYVTQDPVLTTGLADLAPMWQPGGEAGQFDSLFTPLRLIDLPASTGTLGTTPATRDEDLTALFQSAARLLHDDLIRNDPGTARAIRIPWNEFEQFEVLICSDLTVRLDEIRAEDKPVVVHIDARADYESRCLYLTHSGLLGRTDGGGGAIAGLFNADPRRLAQAWLAAMEHAAAHEEAEGLRLANERADQERRQADELIEQMTSALQFEAQTRAGAGRKQAPARGPQPSKAESRPPAKRARPRDLIDPSSLVVADPHGKVVGSTTGPLHRASSRSKSLVEPTRGRSAPQSRSSPRNYTDIDKESLGLHFARMVLQYDNHELADLRAQRGVGADAIDELSRFYELKVYAGPEPDEIRLTDSEVKRALATPEFFLVVVSDIEQGGEPKVRIIAQPLAQLQKCDNREMRLSGVRSARSLVYRLAVPDEVERADSLVFKDSGVGENP